MDPQDFIFTDLTRWLFGNLPWWFMFECAIRLTFFYALLIFCMRNMGARMPAFLTRNEMTAMVSLAAMIGIPIQAPDRGLVPALVVALVILAVHRAISILAIRYGWWEGAALDKPDALVINGCLDLKAVEKNSLSRELVWAQLRSKGITNLCQVKQFYFEPDGGFSLQKADTNGENHCGLSLIPDWDIEMRQRAHLVQDTFVCRSCGLHKKQSLAEASCSNCHALDYEPAFAC